MFVLTKTVYISREIGSFPAVFVAAEVDVLKDNSEDFQLHLLGAKLDIFQKKAGNIKLELWQQKGKS